MTYKNNKDNINTTMKGNNTQGIQIEAYGPADRLKDNLKKVETWDKYEKGIRIIDNKWECWIKIKGTKYQIPLQKLSDGTICSPQPEHLRGESFEKVLERAEVQETEEEQTDRERLSPVTKLRDKEFRLFEEANGWRFSHSDIQRARYGERTWEDIMRDSKRVHDELRARHEQPFYQYKVESNF